MSTATRRAADVFAGMEGEEVIDNSQHLQRIVSSASQVHGWDTEQKPSSDLTLNMLGGRALISVNPRSTPDPAAVAKPIEAIVETTPQIDMEALRVLTVAVGPEEAARRMGVPVEKALPFAAK